MKKITKILAAAAVLACGLILSGCAAAETIKETVVENVNGSYKQWYKYNKTVNVPLLKSSDSDDLDEESTQQLKDAEIYFYFNPTESDEDAGLTVSIQSQTQQTVELLKGLYSQNMTITVGANKNYSLNEFKKSHWYALWGSGKIQKASEPKIHSNPDECIVIGGNKEKDKEAKNAKIQWKKVLANYLLKSLLED